MPYASRAEATARLVEIRELLADPHVTDEPRRFQELAREHSRLEEIVTVWEELDRIRVTIREARQILASGEDPDLEELANDELAQAEGEAEHRLRRLRSLLIPKDPDDSRNTIVEIRAGTGGGEATLFAADLFRMYARYAERNGWRLEIMSSSPSEVGGYKEIIFLLTGTDVFGNLRYESGVHRVQRVPDTETQGRIHTSAASVVVLPEAEEVEVAIDPEELRIDVFRSSGPGGQSVNTTDSAVRVTHLPTGLVVSCQDEKSQHKNKAKALKILRARLLEQVRGEQAAQEAAERRQMVAGGDRSAKIRTYNYPQNRLTDHRVKLTRYNLSEILQGDLEEVIEEVRVGMSGHLALAVDLETSS